MNPESEVVAKAADKAIQNPELEQKIVDEGTENERVLVKDPKAASVLSRVGYLSWSRACLIKLAEAENSLLSRCKSYITSKFIKVRLWNSTIYTITAQVNAESPKSAIPFVLIHGFAAGVAIWAGNLDALASKRTVHAFDILGFGRSSRPTFNTDPTIAELEFVQSIEDWRKEMNIEKMILVGHSFGGFLASSYTLEHPNRVRHLILVDPWGFPIKPAIEQVHIPGWMRFLGTVLSKFNPLATLRFAGPFGTTLIKSLRSDLGTRYALEKPEAIYEYIYQCNAQNPTGENAFSTMTKSFGWAKRPMINRFNGIDAKIPVTFILGSKSWIDSGPAYEIQVRRPDSYVDVQLLSGAGHHVYADVSEAFNELCSSISDIIDGDEDSRPISDSNPHNTNNNKSSDCCENEHKKDLCN